MYFSYVSMFIIVHFYRKGFRFFILRAEFPYNGLVAAPSGHLYLVPGKASHVGIIEIEQPSRRGKRGDGSKLVNITQKYPNTYLVGGLEPWNFMTFQYFPYVMYWKCHHPN
jgi:hypothetical protein